MLSKMIGIYGVNNDLLPSVLNVWRWVEIKMRDMADLWINNIQSVFPICLTNMRWTRVWFAPQNQTTWTAIFLHFTTLALTQSVMPISTVKDIIISPPNENIPNSKVHGANMGPIWGQQDPGGPHVGPMNFAIWDNIMLVAVRYCIVQFK